MRAIKLRVQVLLSNYLCWGVTAGKASHNPNNARGVTAHKMGRNSSSDKYSMAYHSINTVTMIMMSINSSSFQIGACRLIFKKQHCIFAVEIIF